MISKYGRQWVAGPIARMVAWLHYTGVTPNTLTIVGFSAYRLVGDPARHRLFPLGRTGIAGCCNL